MRPEKQKVEGYGTGSKMGRVDKKPPSFSPRYRHGDDPIKCVWVLCWVLWQLLPGDAGQPNGKERSNLNFSLDHKSSFFIISTCKRNTNSRSLGGFQKDFHKGSLSQGALDSGSELVAENSIGVPNFPPPTKWHK